MSVTCLEFNISEAAIILKWKKDFTTFGLKGLISKTRGRPITMGNFKLIPSKSDKPLIREEEMKDFIVRMSCKKIYKP